MLGRELCSAACSALVALQSKVTLAKPSVKKLLVNGLLPLMAVVQAVSLLVLFVILWYPLNNNRRVVEARCTKRMGDFVDKRVRAGKSGLNPPFITTVAVMVVQLQGLLAPELAALLPPCRLEGKISPYYCPPKFLGRMGLGFSPVCGFCHSTLSLGAVHWSQSPFGFPSLISVSPLQFWLSFLRLFSLARHRQGPQNQSSHDNGEDYLRQHHSSPLAMGSQCSFTHELPLLAQAACSQHGPGKVGSRCGSKTL